MLRRTLALVAAALAVVATVLVADATAAPAQAQAAPAPVNITGVDLHDGTIRKIGATYHLYGTQYACGFSWRTPNTPWCGFGVATAPSLSGPWSPITTLVRADQWNPYRAMTFGRSCGGDGQGCFNPRMIQRSGWGNNDGAWILWFNEPGDTYRDGSNAYYALGCNSPVGPCGAEAGAPWGSTTKPPMDTCRQDGDFSLVEDAPRAPLMLCTMQNHTLAAERLAVWGNTGQGGDGRTNLTGFGAIEGPGAYRDAASGKWILTYSDPTCPYCAGSATSFATADALTGPWLVPQNRDAMAGATNWGRRGMTATSCGGQARTVTVLDGQPYQFVDLWRGTPNERDAGIFLQPLTYRNQPNVLDGRPWAPFAPWAC